MRPLAAGLLLAAAAAPTRAEVPDLYRRVASVHWVVKDLDHVKAGWEKLGFPAMEITHGPLFDLVYRGQRGRFDQKLGWHRHGTITWEWIEPLAGPTVYEDFLKEHGEGFHHFAFDVPDIDAAGASWEALGVPIVQCGAWGEKGKPGSGPLRLRRHRRLRRGDDRVTVELPIGAATGRWRAHSQAGSSASPREG
jgi:methylmalonyl-CoA/ethylmalonyl-CoA epimerase